MTTSSPHARARDVFFEAVSREPAERGRFVERACGGDEALRDEVLSLLAHHDADDEPFPARSSEAEAAPMGGQRFRRERTVVVAAAVAGLVALVWVGAWVRGAIRNSIESSTEATMTSLLNAQILAIEAWIDAQTRLAASWARVPAVVDALAAIDRAVRRERLDAEAIAAIPEQRALHATLERLCRDVDESFRFAAWSTDGRLLADRDADSTSLGAPVTELGGAMVARILAGESFCWFPTRRGFLTAGWTPPPESSKPGMSVVVPVAHDDDRPFAALMVELPGMQERLEGFLDAARFGDTGEAYAFGDNGYLVTESRFLDQLHEIGLVSDDPDAFSAHVVRVADPGGNLLEGHEPELPREDWPLTLAARSATSGRRGGDLGGYRDYRGVEVVGVWAWLPEHEIGIALEADRDEVLAPLDVLHSAFHVLLALLAGVGAVAFVTSLTLVRARRAVRTGRRIGPYRIAGKIGEGGLATVYLAEHELLKRPTAIKVLRPEVVDARNRNRFEREVRLASRLTHANTIEIYDYGPTPDGQFYCAMELVSGWTLKELVQREGAQPAERVVHVLAQVARSLREAHGLGLVHRDVKPQNVMLCERGGEPDVVKVLDFGLAREVLPGDGLDTTSPGDLVGTPLYVAPERIRDPSRVDPRSDVYSLGVVAYELLSGEPPFTFASPMDALDRTLYGEPRRPSSVVGDAVPEELDDLVRDCQERDPLARPQDMDAVLDRLAAVPLGRSWTRERARAWWDAARGSSHVAT